eukprot:g13924.t1
MSMSMSMPMPMSRKDKDELGDQFHGGGVGGGFGGGSRGEAGGGATTGRHFGGRRPRQSEAATFFNSLDENSDGVLAENEIREFVGYVGGSTLDDNSEILGGVSSVMGHLDTDSEEGIGLKELSSWINRLGSMLTVEEAAEWVTHAVQLPPEVAEAFRSNSISAYDFPELVEDNGAGLDDLGIKRKFWKRIVKAIEIRLLGLGDEPPRPLLHAPTYLGAGKVRVEWSAGGLAVESTEYSVKGMGHQNHHDDDDDHDDDGGDDDDDGNPSASSHLPSSSPGAAAELVPAGGVAPTARAHDDEAPPIGSTAGPEGEGSGEGSERHSERGATGAESERDRYKAHAVEVMADGGQLALPWRPPPPPPPPPPRAATFPVHKYVLQRSCLRHYSRMATSASTTADGGTVENSGGGGGNGGGLGQDAARFGESAAASNDEGWVTVHEADDLGFIAASSSFVFVDSGLSPGKTYLYRVRAWNLIGHSEAPTAHVVTPAVPSLWTKPWRVISPWFRTGNSSSASQGSAASLGGSEAASSLPQSAVGGAAGVGGDGGGGAVLLERGLGVDAEAEGRDGWGWREVLAAAWAVLCWVGWGVAGLVKVLQAVLVLATLQTNLTRLRAAYGHGGTGTALRRNWAASLVWKLNHVVTRNRVISGAIGALNDRLEQAIGLPPLPPSAGGRGLRRQSSTRNFRGSSGVERERDRPRGGRTWSPSSRAGSRDGSRDYYSSGEEDDDRDGLVRIDEDYSGMGVGVGGGGGVRGRGAQYYHARRGYPPITPGGGGGGGAPWLGRRRSSPSMARPPRQHSSRQQHQESDGHSAVASLTLWRSSRQVCRGRNEEREPAFPGEDGGHSGVVSSPKFSPYATRSDIIPNGRAVGARNRHNQHRHHSRGSSSSRGSSGGSRHGRLHSDDRERHDKVDLDLDLDLDRARGPSNASAGSASSLLSSSSRRPFPEERSAELSDHRRRGRVAGAGGVEEPRPGGRRGWFWWGKGTGTADGVGGSVPSPGAEAGAEMMVHRRGESGRRGSFGLSAEYLDGIVDDGDGEGDDELLSDGGFSDGFTFAGVGGGDLYGRRSEGDAGGVEIRPTLERTGSSMSMDFRRAMPHFRKSSVSRLALGLKKGEASGRDGWRKEYHAAQACFSCHKPFKVTRQRHHCGRCHRVFCSKHGYTSHVKGSVCSIPGDCICDVCLESVATGGGGGGENPLVNEDAYQVSEPRRRSLKAKLKAVKAVSETGASATASIGSAPSVVSEAGEVKAKRGRRFDWRRSASFGQFRRRRRAATDHEHKHKHDQDYEHEHEKEEAFLEASIRGRGGTNHRPNDSRNTRSAGTLAGRSTAASGSDTLPRVASGRAVAVTASPSADGSSPATVHDYRAVAAGNTDAHADHVIPDDGSGGARRTERRGEGWGGVFGGASRRITR